MLAPNILNLMFTMFAKKLLLVLLLPHYVPSTLQVVNILTKALFKHHFHTFQIKLGILPPLPSGLRGSDKEKKLIIYHISKNNNNNNRIYYALSFTKIYGEEIGLGKILPLALISKEDIPIYS